MSKTVNTNQRLHTSIYTYLTPSIYLLDVKLTYTKVDPVGVMHWRLVFSLMMMELYKFDDIKKGKRCFIPTIPTIYICMYENGMPGESKIENIFRFFFTLLAFHLKYKKKEEKEKMEKQRRRQVYIYKCIRFSSRIKSCF